jgi:ankyrin repeat protein
VRAANYNHLDIVKLIVEAGVDINIKSLKGGNTALMKGIYKLHAPYFVFVN